MTDEEYAKLREELIRLLKQYYLVGVTEALARICDEFANGPFPDWWSVANIMRDCADAVKLDSETNIP
jgi:hypothetical protein